MAKLNNNIENDRFALRDYHHAAKTFTSEPGYEKLPYSGFLFHVNISFNSVTSGFNIDTKNISLLIKAADLPEVVFETEILNQYNRKRIINKKVMYQPISLTFHDDVANNVRNMWISYNQHYSLDSRYVDENTWKLDNVYQSEGISRRYGLDSGADVPFINKIEIYSMGNHQYSKMLLVNPVIASAKFDDHEYSGGDKVMETILTLEYENIIYSTGTTDQIPGFGTDNVNGYDQTPSTLGITAPYEVFGSSSTRIPRINTPVVARTPSQIELTARQIDPISGNVSRNNSPGLNRIDNNQYQEIKKSISNLFSNTQNEFLFPDTSIASQNEALLSIQSQRIDEARIARSTNISSNGENISMFRVSENVSTTPIVTADTVQTADILIRPRVPSGLNSAEQQLFNISYPPLPSTDPRVKSPPYV